MNQPGDIALLREWLEGCSDAAFRVLVDRYAPLVWGAALRTAGDRGMAEEAVQQVFATLARKARTVAGQGRPLAAWLHRAAVYEAAAIRRREKRHRERMRCYAVTDPVLPQAETPLWERMSGHLDEAINSLGDTDRRVLLLHWFDRRTFAEVAERIGCTPAAAQRRGLRALYKLAAALKKRGAAVSSAVLAAGLTAQLTPSVPAAVAAQAQAAAASAAVAPVLFPQQCLHAMASAKFITAAVFLISAALPAGVRLARAERQAAYPPSLPPAAVPLPSSHSFLPVSADAAPLDLSLMQLALRRFLADPDDYTLQLELRRLMFSLTAAELPAVKDILTNLPVRNGAKLEEVNRALFARWAELEPAGAAQAAMSMPAVFGDGPLHGALVSWTAADPDAASSWLEQNVADPARRYPLLGDMLAALTACQNDRRPVMARVDAIADEEWRRNIRRRVIRVWADLQSPFLEEWARNLTPGPMRDEWLSETQLVRGTENPEIAYYQRGMSDPALHLKTWRTIARQYLRARHPATGTSDFVSNLKNLTHDYPPEIYFDAGEITARHGAEFAVENARELPPGRARDAFIRGMLSAASGGQAKAMLPALSMIPEESLAGHPAAGIFIRALARQDPGAAAEWICSLPADSVLRAQAEAHSGNFSRGSSAAGLNPSDQ